MAESLRPMSTGELLDRTFTLYRRNFVLFVGIAAFAPALYLVLQLVLAAFVGMGRMASNPAPGIAGYATIGIGVILGVIAWMAGLAITTAATIRAVSAVHLGRSTGIREAYGALKGRLGRILGIFLSVTIRVFGGWMLLMLVGVFLAAMAFAATAPGGPVGIIVGTVAAIVVMVAAALFCVGLFVRYSLAVQACVVEDVTGKEALRRSGFLAKGARSRILTVYSLFVVLNFSIGMLIGLAAQGMTALVGPGMMAAIFEALAGFIAGALTGPLATIAMSLVYYDERVRKEAFDLQLMMAALDGPPPAISAASAP